MTAPATEFGVLAVQYADAPGGPWTTFGSPTSFGTYLRTRRFGLGPGLGVTAQYWRVVKLGATDYGAAIVHLNQFVLRRETAEISAVRAWSFAFDTETQRYILVATDGNAEVYKNGVRVASIALPYFGSMLPTVTKAQALDTMVQWHSRVPPQRVSRQGGDGEWDIRALTLTNLPTYDYTGENLGAVSEVQQIRFTNYVNGDTFNISLEGETTPSIAFTTTAGAMASAIEAALEGLPNVGADGVSVVGAGTNIYTVTFTGQNAGQDLAEMAPSTISSSAGGVFANTITQGKEGGEPVISAARGWPSCGAFYQSRLWMAGLTARPGTLIGSRLGSYFDFDTRGAKADSGIDVTIDTDQNSGISQLFPGRHLQVLTSSAEFYFPSEPIVPPPAVKQATRRGSVAGIPAAELDGATVFVTKGGDALAEFLWDYGQDSYSAAHLSVLASHLVRGVVDMGFRASRSTNQTDLALMVRDNGYMTVMSALRSQEITGFASWTTDGAFRAAVGDVGGDLYVVTQRVCEGVNANFLEQVDYDAMLDAELLFGPGGGVLTDLDHLEGRTVCLYIDGADAGDAIVENGSVTLPYPALRSVRVGLLFVPRFDGLPIVMDDDPRSGASMGARSGEIAFRLGPTANLRAGIVGGKLWTVPLKRRPQTNLDEGPGENPFTGWTRLTCVPGFRGDAQVRFEQSRPGPLSVQELVVTVES